MADEVVNIDLTADELIERLKAGKIYRPDKIAAALGNRDEARRFLLMALAERDRELDRAAVEKRLSELESAR